MKINLATSDLNKLLTKIQNVIPQKATIPILSNLLIEAKNNQITLTATDLTVSMKCLIEARVLQEGATTIPAKRFIQLMRELTTPEVEIETDENNISIIKAGSSTFKLHGMSAEEYPDLPNLENADKFTIEQQELKYQLSRTSFAVAKEDPRIALMGVLFRIAKGSLVLLGTDGRRLARSYSTIDIDPTHSASYIVPLKAVEEMIKVLDSDENATIYLLQDKIALEANRSIVISKLINEDYPDVERVIPKKLENKLTLHREELISLLRQISLFTPEESQAVRFTFTEGMVSLAANSVEVGEGNVNMAVNYQGPKIEIAFNPQYFLDALRHSKSETIKLGFNDPFNPGIITDDEEVINDDKAGPTPLFLLMPMRLSTE